MFSRIPLKTLAEEEVQKLRKIRDILEEIIETLDLLLNKEALEKLNEAEQDIKEEKIRKWEEFIKEKESKPKSPALNLSYTLFKYFNY
ncbi:MAG: hypothetical protein DRO09_04115 [Thermoprotei archaeon]|nr:MAG: hypothetical protein DRO09_04115 [Thermoprotei archaeon]